MLSTIDKMWKLFDVETFQFCHQINTFFALSGFGRGGDVSAPIFLSSKILLSFPHGSNSNVNENEDDILVGEAQTHGSVMVLRLEKEQNKCRRQRGFVPVR